MPGCHYLNTKPHLCQAGWCETLTLSEPYKVLAVFEVCPICKRKRLLGVTTL
jgi:hypothetical protein